MLNVSTGIMLYHTESYHLMTAYCFWTYLPREAVALAAVVPEVAHFAVLDVHPRLSHLFLGPASARLAVVGDDFRDGADVRPPVGLVVVGGVGGGIP